MSRDRHHDVGADPWKIRATNCANSSGGSGIGADPGLFVRLRKQWICLDAGLLFRRLGCRLVRDLAPDVLTNRAFRWFSHGSGIGPIPVRISLLDGRQNRHLVESAQIDAASKGHLRRSTCRTPVWSGERGHARLGTTPDAPTHRVDKIDQIQRTLQADRRDNLAIRSLSFLNFLKFL